MQHQFEQSGKLKAPSDAALKKADAGTFIIAYTSGTMADGRAYYAYLAVRPSKYREFYQKSAAREPIVLSHYGKILISGFSASPPPDVKKHMREKHGFDEHYEAALKAEVSRQRHTAHVQQEEQRLMDIVAMMKKAKNLNGSRK